MNNYKPWKNSFQKYSEPGELKYVEKDFETVTINKDITNASSSSVVASDPK